MSPNDNKTYSPKPGDLTRDWHVIDASDVVLGRLAVQVATLLRGKHKPTFAPHMDGGDFVVIVNASKIASAMSVSAESRRRSPAVGPDDGSIRMSSGSSR